MSGAILGTSNRVDKFDDELEFEQDESFDFYVSVMCHTRQLLCTGAHLFQKRRLGELFGAGMLDRAYVVFISGFTYFAPDVYIIHEKKN